MEQNSLEKAVKILGSLDSKELEIVNRAIEASRSKKLPFGKASDLIAHQGRGDSMIFTDKRGKTHIGVIKKINQRYIQMFDPKEKKYHSALPDSLKIATKEDIEGTSAQKEPTRTKRAYRRRNKPELKKDEHGNVIFGRRKTDIKPE